jgi:hypothetical protein
MKLKLNYQKREVQTKTAQLLVCIVVSAEEEWELYAIALLRKKNRNIDILKLNKL